MRERIDITTVESATKIRAKYLRALENEEWDQLPGPTFVRTFLRTYAEYLGLDPKMLVEDYKQRFERPGPQDVMPFGPRPGRRPPRQSRGVPPWVIVGLAVVLLIGILFVIGTWGDDPASDDPVAKPTPAATEERRTAAERRRARARRERRQRAAAEPKVVSLRILPEAAVYVCLEDASGRQLVAGENLEEATRTFRSKRLRVTFGNGLVRMRVGDRTYGVPDTDAAVGYSLRPGGRPRRLSDDLPDCA